MTENTNPVKRTRSAKPSAISLPAEEETALTVQDAPQETALSTPVDNTAIQDIHIENAKTVASAVKAETAQNVNTASSTIADVLAAIEHRTTRDAQILGDAIANQRNTTAMKAVQYAAGLQNDPNFPDIGSDLIQLYIG